MIRVKAKMLGFMNGSRVYPGTELVVEDHLFSSKWMDRLDPEPVQEIVRPARKKVVTAVSQNEEVL